MKRRVVDGIYPIVKNLQTTIYNYYNEMIVSNTKDKNMDIESEYHYLLTKTKQQIIAGMGNEFDYHSTDIWIYLLKTNWWGKKTYILIYFDDNKVKNIKIKKTFKKLIT